MENLIELNNFGSYKDYNAFNLNTSDPGKKIVIIGGKNGAGKTTLFVAVELALYGHYCFGYKNSGKRYTKKIMTYINDQAKMDEDENAYVAIEFSDSTNGDLDQYRIVRSWSWKKGEPKEDFQVVKNGHHLADQDLADFQTFLLHLIPPALLKLCFFDAISKITKEIYDLSLQSQSKQTELTACEEDIIAAEKELETAYKKLEMDIKRRSVSAISSKVLLLLEDLQVIIFDRLIREVREDTVNGNHAAVRTS